VLWELEDGDILRFRCRTGHAWTSGSLEAQQGTAVEEALWASLRALEDAAAMAERLVERAGGMPRAKARYRENARRAHEHGEVIRRLLLDLGPLAGNGDDDAIADRKAGCG
jgi:two-component system, chemotaxis family, protein-glutamate methylesterase/glutaminase